MKYFLLLRRIIGRYNTKIEAIQPRLETEQELFVPFLNHTDNPIPA